jgi:hypothetical protein
MRELRSCGSVRAEGSNVLGYSEVSAKTERAMVYKISQLWDQLESDPTIGRAIREKTASNAKLSAHWSIDREGNLDVETDERERATAGRALIA